jgi:hypothetical protein
MGRGYDEYLFPESGRREGVLYSAFIQYRLSDGTKLVILEAPAWCPACERFVVAEDIPSVVSLEEELRGLQAGDSDLLDKWEFVSNGAPVEQRIAELRRRIKWRRGRRSPPRCLHCGSLGIVPIPGSGELTHPQTGERGFLAWSGFIDTDIWVAEFSPEGEQLGGGKA